MTPAGGDTEDPLGLDVEGEAAFPEDQLQVRSSSIPSVDTQPTQGFSSYYLVTLEPGFRIKNA